MVSTKKKTKKIKNKRNLKVLIRTITTELCPESDCQTDQFNGYTVQIHKPLISADHLHCAVSIVTIVSNSDES